MPELQVDWRPAHRDDQPFLRQVFEEARENIFSNFPLEAKELRQLVDMQFQAQQSSYRTSFPNAEFNVVLLDGQDIGLLYLSDAKCLHLLDIALLHEFRNRGVGTVILKRLLDRAITADKDMNLQVEHDNPARRLYERFGFIETGRDHLRAEMVWKLNRG